MTNDPTLEGCTVLPPMEEPETKPKTKNSPVSDFLLSLTPSRWEDLPEAMGDYVMVLLDIKKEPDGGLALPDNSQERAKAVVVSAGPGVLSLNGTFVSYNLDVGDVVYFPERPYPFIEHEGRKFYFVRQADIFAVN